jgi:DNA polymerase III, alpha subunit
VKKNYTAELAENIFDLIMEFADYGFVKSHAVAYGKVAYTMAYMKLYYPEHFYAVILTHHRGNDEKISQLLTELKMMRIPLLAPDINTSIWQNSQQEGILLGFSMISGISRPLYEALMAARKHGGPFKDIYDLVSRTDFKFNEKILRNLIISGALDGFEENRKTMLQTLPDILSTVSDGYQHDSFLSSLGFNLKKEYRYSEEMDGAEKIEGEKEALGFYISTHPILLKHRELEFIPFSLIHHKRKHGTYLLYIEDFRTIKVKKTGQNMAFLTLTDGHSNIDGVLFAKEYFKYHPMLKESIVAADATYGMRQGKPQLVIDRLYPADDYVRTYIEKTKKIYIRDVSIDEISELLAESGVPIHDFNTQEFAGYIPISKIETLISNIQVENIRLIV